MELFKKGCITGKILAGHAMGTAELYDFVEKYVEMAPMAIVNDPVEIAKNDNMVSINCCLMSDLTGQIGSESIGPRQYSAIGGQLDFVRGASMSKGGRSFLCMPSTITVKGEIQSTIVSALPTARFCQLIEPYTDLIHVSTGHYYKPGRSKEFSTAIDPHGLNVADAVYIKERINIPVAVVGGINSPEMAEELIASGKVDMVSLGRQLFADPDFPNKAQNGQEHLIRRCLRCARCYPGPLGEHETEKKMGFVSVLGSCTVNPYMVWPFSHHDDKFPDEYEDIECPKNVLVIGGGVGGIQAAITACDRGHHVTLLEKSGRLGGIINFTEFSEHKQDIWNFVNEIAGELKERNVEIKLNTEATVELVKNMKPDAVVVATGSDTLMLPIPGIENAIPALDTYYKGFKAMGKTTIILGAGLVGCEAAIDYAAAGIHSIIVEKAGALVPEGFGIYRTAVCDKIDELGIEYKVNAKVVSIGKDFVEVQYENSVKEVIKADSVVNALGRRPVKDLAEALKAEMPEQSVYEIGDCQKVAQIGDAVSAGWTAAMNIR